MKLRIRVKVETQVHTTSLKVVTDGAFGAWRFRSARFRNIDLISEFRALRQSENASPHRIGNANSPRPTGSRRYGAN